MEPILPSTVTRSGSPERRAGSTPTSGAAEGAKRRVVGPRILALLGVLLLIVGTGLVATPLSLHRSDAASPQTPPPAPVPAAGVDGEDVPLGALSLGGSKEGATDCAVTLPDREGYLSRAAAAEVALLGKEAREFARPEELEAALAALPRLLVSLTAWALASPGHPWGAGQGAAAEGQVTVLNAAFARAGMAFRLDGLVVVPATDAEVTSCSDGRGGSGVNGSSWPGQAASSPGNASVHVVVCEPAGGVNGASHILGGGGGEEEGGWAGEEGQPPVVVLRRSALWQSQTSLVHQLGHLFGLAHPFPDAKSCKADADGVADTARQFAPHAGCDPEEEPRVCRGAEGAVPVFNFMDLSNDTCRQTFTLGQVARMRAMVRALRPQLYTAALQQRPRVALAVAAASQSGLPPPAVLQVQAWGAQASTDNASFGWKQDYNNTAGSATGGNASAAAAALDAALRLAGYRDPWLQAQLAADGSLVAAPEHCACVGPDSQGRVLWQSMLNASYAVDAVWLLLPSMNASLLNGTAGGEVWGPLLLDVRIGSSLDPGRNARCAMLEAEQQVGQWPQLLEAECPQPLLGRYVSVTAQQQQQRQQQRQQLSMCLCEVQPLAFISPPRSVPLAGVSDFPGVFLDLSAMEASQSSSLRPAAMALSGNSSSLGQQASCSSTAGEEEHPWWSLDTGLDGVTLRGLRLSLPANCSQSEGARCKASILLDITISDLPPSNSSTGFTPGGRAVTCAAGVAALPGQPVDVDCGAFLSGRHITISLAAVAGAAAGGAAPPLELCSVQLIGAYDVSLADYLSPRQGERVVAPATSRPRFATAIDGDAGSCLEADASQALWRAGLRGALPVVGLSVASRGAAASASVLDTGGSALWTGSVPSVGVHELPAPVWASAASVSNFTQLCEVRLLATETALTLASALRSGSGGARWTALTAAGAGAGAAVDSSYRSCAATRQGESAGIQIRLGRPYSVLAVQLVADVAAGRLEVATLQPGMGALAWGLAWAQSRLLAAESMPVEPWAEATARSATGGPVLTDTLLVRAGGEEGGNGSALSLCDVAVLGEPVAALY